jgi:hypothetical protein
MSEANKELVRCNVEEVFNSQNFAACDEIMAEDFVEHAVAPFGQSAVFGAGFKPAPTFV